jgi:putative hydrolase of the HAD superfamily
MSNPTYQYILFDLDDTLYPKEAGVMKALIERMQQFMVHRLGIPTDDAAMIRQRFRRQYGTTLCGLMEEYHIDPHEFLAYVHNINLYDFMAASPPLNRMLTEIPLQKAIFTNADTAHARRVLDVLQVRAHFSTIIDIHAVQYKNKPNPLAYQHALALLGTTGEACIMVEDMPRNLMPAKELGMTTILVDGANAPQPPAIGIDFVVPTIFHVGKILQNLIPMEGTP